MHPVFFLPLRILVLICCSVALGAQRVHAIEIEEIVWGFDGRVKPNDFNLISVLISNPSPEPFEGSFRLQKRTGSGQHVGAIIEEPVYVSPFASRWVQFYPYITGRRDEWALSWNRGRSRYNIVSPAINEKPARVLLEDPGNLNRRGGSVKRFPENLFPPIGTATSALGVVILDHAPRWEEARRQAFLDWLHGGGTVHVIYGTDRKYPEFSASLAELGTPLEKQRVGSGVVYKHPRTRNELDSEFINSILSANPSSSTGNPEQDPLEEASAGNADQQSSGYEDYDQSWDSYNSDNGFFSNLKQMTRVNHNWALIYLMAFLYILLIFPGCYVLGRLRVDYRLTIGSLLATVAVFSLGFLLVGRRGYGESTIVHSVAIARYIDNGDYDVRQWSNVFVTDGDYYSINHEGNERLYSTCQDFEAVNGVIHSGRDGQFFVDIPPFSSRTFAHRTKLEGDPVSIKVQTWKSDEVLHELLLSINENFPEKTQQIYVLFRDRFYSLSRKPGRLHLKTNVGSVSGFLRLDEYSDYQYYGGMTFYDSDDDRTPDERFRSMLVPLMARNLGVSDEKEINAFSLPDDRIRLFAYSPMPEPFFVRNNRFARQSGYVLYCFDVFNTESP